MRFDLLTFIAFDLFPPLSLEKRVADPLTVCAVLTVGFDTYSLAFLHFFSFQFSFYLVGTLHLGKEGSSTLLFMMFAKTKRQARLCLFTFYISLRLAKIGIVEGGKERLTLLLSYINDK